MPRGAWENLHYGRGPNRGTGHPPSQRRSVKLAVTFVSELEPMIADDTFMSSFVLHVFFMHVFNDLKTTHADENFYVTFVLYFMAT